MVKISLSQFLKDDFKFPRQARERKEDSSSRRKSIYKSDMSPSIKLYK